ncbi:MAG: hypothetical protein WEA56_12970 [Balneolaceae bacterium]
MYKDVLRSIEGIATFPIIALMLFLGFFIAMLIYLFKKDKSHWDEAARLPLETDESIQTLDTRKNESI